MIGSKLSVSLRFAGRLGLFAAALALAPLAAHADDDAEEGKALYDANCSTCHGPGGKGDGPVGSALQPPPRDFTIGDFKLDADKDGKPGSDADLALVIAQGAAAFGGSPMMAPWGHLSEDDRADLVAYVRSLHK